jgi:hypothetical protein
MEHTGDDEYDTRALPTGAFIKMYLDYDKPTEAMNSNNRAHFHQYLHFKSTCAKILLATSKLHVSMVKCRQTLKTMILENEKEFRHEGLALHHMMFVHGQQQGNICRERYRRIGETNFASPVSWSRSIQQSGHYLYVYIREGLELLDKILLGEDIYGLWTTCCESHFRYYPRFNDNEVWDESCGTESEWNLTRYAKLLLHGLRKLMQTVLVEDGAALENVLELFRVSCAEAIAQFERSVARDKVRLYAACILECTLSSGSYYLMDLADKCKGCEDCRMISSSHENLLLKINDLSWNKGRKVSPLTSRDEIVELSRDCDQLLDNFRATFIRPNGAPFVSHLRITDQALKCGDIRDILMAAKLFKLYRSLADGRGPPGFFVGTTFYHPGSKLSMFHGRAHRSPIDSNKTKKHIKRAILLAGDRDLITLRVDESIFIFAVDRQGLNNTVQAAKASQGSQASYFVTDGEEMKELLKCIQVEGGSATYNNDKFGPFKNAVFTGDQALWIPPLAEDLLQAGVYASVSRGNDEIAICNVVEQAALAEGKYSIRHQKKVVNIRKATRTCADIYQCLDEHTKLTSRMAEGVRIG